MISLITKETCFVTILFTSDSALNCESWLKRDYSDLSMIETTSRGSFNHDQTRTRSEQVSAQKKQKWGYYEATCLVEIWADQETQRHYRRWVGGRIFGTTLPQNLMTNASTMKQHKLSDTTMKSV